MTHSPPAQATLAVEIPAQVKERLRLEAERSRVVLSEWGSRFRDGFAGMTAKGLIFQNSFRVRV